MKKWKVLVVASVKSESAQQLLKTLSRQIQYGLRIAGLRHDEISIVEGNILITTPDEVEVAETVATYCGVKYTAVVEKTSTGFDEVVNLVFQIGRKLIYPGETFNISIEKYERRDYTPRDVEVAAAAMLIEELASTGVRIDEVKPLKTIYAKIDKNSAYVFYFRYNGTNGLVAGSSGRALCILTGDQESGVASWFAIRSGFTPYFLIFDLQPITSYFHLKNALTTALKLRKMIPIGKLDLSVIKQKETLKRLGSTCPSAVLPFLLRRLLIKTACAYAKNIGFDVVVSSGDFVRDPPWLIKWLISDVSAFGLNLFLPNLFLTEPVISGHAEHIGITADYPRLKTRRRLKRESVVNAIVKIESELEVDRRIKEALDNAYRRCLDSGDIDLHSLFDNMS
jgi:thiamine biosynthesis protein ThiI